MVSIYKSSIKLNYSQNINWLLREYFTLSKYNSLIMSIIVPDLFSSHTHVLEFFSLNKSLLSNHEVMNSFFDKHYQLYDQDPTQIRILVLLVYFIYELESDTLDDVSLYPLLYKIYYKLENIQKQGIFQLPNKIFVSEKRQEILSAIKSNAPFIDIFNMFSNEELDIYGV